MDPASVIGLAASVSNLIQASAAVIRVIKDFRDGDKDLASLSHDILIFSEALIGFARVLRSRYTIHRIPASIIENVLKHSRELLDELQARLSQVSASEFSTVRRTKWVQHKSSFTKLHNQLKEQIFMLQSFLSITQTETLHAIMSQQPQSLLATSTTEQTIFEHPAQNATLVTTDATDTTESSSTRISIVSGTGSHERNYSWGSDTYVASSLEPADLVEESIKMVDIVQCGYHKKIPHAMWSIRRSCRWDCRCQCHEAQRNKSQRRCLPFISPKLQCSEPGCQGNAATNSQTPDASASFLYSLAQVLSSKSIKIRYDLKTFRMVPEGSDAIRYIKHGHLEQLKACIDSGEATRWDTAVDGWSLLHVAAYSRQPEIVKYLLELGVDREGADLGLRTAADFAVLKSIGQDATHVEKEIVEMFSKDDDVLADFEFTPIHIAVLQLYDPTDMERPSLEELIGLMDDANNAAVDTSWRQWKTTYKGRSPLFAAILEYFRVSAAEQPESTKIIHNFLDQKDKKLHWTPLHWASSAGRIDEMRILVEHGADPMILSNLSANILHAAAESKIDRGLAGALRIWKRCAGQLNIDQPNVWQETPLHIAAWSSAACVKLLLEAGADPAAREQSGQVALHCAGLAETSPERREVVKLLCAVEDRTHINMQENDGRPPIVDFLDDPECVELLLNHGAMLDLPDNLGQNALHHAAMYGWTASLAMMLKVSDHQIAVAAKNDRGNTPLLEALSNSNVECARMLLELPDVGDAIGKDGWQPVHYAAKIGDADLLEAVFKHPSFQKGAITMDGKRASVVSMEVGKWQGEIKALIRKHDYIDLDDS